MGQNPEDMFGDENYPAYTIGQAAEMLGTTQDFLRRLDETKLINPQRSSGGHRRYSRYQLRLAARARKWSTTAPPWRPRAGSSFWKTNSRKPSGRTRSSSGGCGDRTDQPTLRARSSAGDEPAGPPGERPGSRLGRSAPLVAPLHIRPATAMLCVTGGPRGRRLTPGRRARARRIGCV